MSVIESAVDTRSDVYRENQAHWRERVSRLHEAVQKVKEGILRSSGLPLEEAYRVENEVAGAVLSSRDAREGPRAFAEKRRPNFTGE